MGGRGEGKGIIACFRGKGVFRICFSFLFFFVIL